MKNRQHTVRLDLDRVFDDLLSNNKFEGSHRELADYLNLSASTLSHMINGHRQPPDWFMSAISELEEDAYELEIKDKKKTLAKRNKVYDENLIRYRRLKKVMKEI